jgi:hypothetical protein
MKLIVELPKTLTVRLASETGDRTSANASSYPNTHISADLIARNPKVGFVPPQSRADVGRCDLIAKDRCFGDAVG